MRKWLLSLILIFLFCMYYFMLYFELSFLVSQKSVTDEKNVYKTDFLLNYTIFGSKKPIDRNILLTLGGTNGARCDLYVPNISIYYYVYAWKCQNYSDGSSEK